MPRYTVWPCHDKTMIQSLFCRIYHCTIHDKPNSWRKHISLAKYLNSPYQNQHKIVGFYFVSTRTWIRASISMGLIFFFNFSLLVDILHLYYLLVGHQHQSAKQRPLVSGRGPGVTRAGPAALHDLNKCWLPDWRHSSNLGSLRHVSV